MDFIPIILYVSHAGITWDWLGVELQTSQLLKQNLYIRSSVEANALWCQNVGVGRVDCVACFYLSLPQLRVVLIQHFLNSNSHVLNDFHVTRSPDLLW